MNNFIFEKSMGRIGYFDKMQHKTLAFFYNDLIYKLRPNMEPNNFMQLILNDIGKPGWFSAEVATFSLLQLDTINELKAIMLPILPGDKTFEYKIITQNITVYLEIKNWGANFNSITKIKLAYENEVIKGDGRNVILVFNTFGKPIPLKLLTELKQNLEALHLDKKILFIDYE